MGLLIYPTLSTLPPKIVFPIPYSLFHRGTLIHGNLQQVLTDIFVENQHVVLENNIMDVGTITLISNLLK